MSIFDIEPVSPEGSDEPDDSDRAKPAAADTPRPFLASAARIKLSSKSAKNMVRGSKARIWQRAAWDYFDQIGEVKYAFNMIGSIMSRIRLYPGIIDKPDEPPVPLDQWKDRHPNVESDTIRELEIQARQALDDLANGFRAGGIGSYLRMASLNLIVAGEYFLVRVDDTRWTVASVDELHTDGSSWELRQTQDAASTTRGIRLKKDNYTARIWRAHPRWSREPDSSMVGVLDQCEKLLLLDRLIRATARSRMSAGLMYIPDGVTINESTDDEVETPIEETIHEAISRVAEDEEAANTIIPLILRGPGELADAMSKSIISLGRAYDPELQEAADRALDRVLTGLDVPKDSVTGLADVKYANAIVIDDALYKAHIEPLAMHCADSLTFVYLQPYLKRLGVPKDLVDRVVFWYDPSEIVTKPDRSTAANEGYDRYTLSAKAWRNARGFGDSDKPAPEEALLRFALEKGMPPADIVLSILQSYAPDAFAKMQAIGQSSAGFDSEVSKLVNDNGNGNGNETPEQRQSRKVPEPPAQPRQPRAPAADTPPDAPPTGGFRSPEPEPAG